MALVFFISAGNFSWQAGWMYLGIFALFSISLTLWLLKKNPSLLEERIGFKPNQKPWDKVFLLSLNVVFLVWIVLMPLDAVRFHWSKMPPLLQLVGAAVLFTSFYIFYLTFRENPYLSASVRIQEDRGQTVISTGPYRHVRHQMYSRGFLYFLGTALLLGSWCGVLFVPVFTAMIAVRAVFEERMLKKELKGYSAYMAKVKYRFIPRVW
jgi:protein-S-isoprenylcysteine O-methyltransferase Ste14